MSRKESQARAVKQSLSRRLMRRKPAPYKHRDPVIALPKSTECTGTIRILEGKRYLSCPADCPKHTLFVENEAFNRTKPEREQSRNPAYSGKVYN